MKTYFIIGGGILAIWIALELRRKQKNFVTTGTILGDNGLAGTAAGTKVSVEVAPGVFETGTVNSSGGFSVDPSTVPYT